MRSILLAVDGLMPDREAFRYALGMCRRMRAGLEVLQIVQGRHLRELAQRLKGGVANARRRFESAMAAAAFAEAGEAELAQRIVHEVQEQLERMVPEEERKGIPIHTRLTMGRPEKEIPRYVGDHPHVVVAIYNTETTASRPLVARTRKRSERNPLRKELPVPLVVFPGR